jgi:hypothetical protein
MRIWSSPIGFYQDARRDGGFEAGIETAVRALLASPQFLFRVERGAAPHGASSAAAQPHSGLARVSDLDLASRLSFFLWSSVPDDELLDAAEQGKLSDPATLNRQVTRMLHDARAEALVTNFADQWLQLRNLNAARRPIRGCFPISTRISATRCGEKPSCCSTA